MVTGHVYSSMLSGLGLGMSPLTLFVSPPAPTIICTLPGGAVVAQITTAGGDGNPISLSLTGDTTDFVLSGIAPPANVLVAPTNISPTVCGDVVNVTVTATQP
jgi:hypothetical protein